MKTSCREVIICFALLAANLGAQSSLGGRHAAADKQQILWQRLESSIRDIDNHLDGVLGVAIADLTTGQKFLLRQDEVFPQASSIKIAVLTELCERDPKAAKEIQTEIQSKLQRLFSQSFAVTRFELDTICRRYLLEHYED